MSMWYGICINIMTISKIFQNIKMELERVQRVRQIIPSMLSIKSTRPPLNLRWKCPFWLNFNKWHFHFFFRKDYYTTKGMVRVIDMVRGIFITNLLFFTIWMHQLLKTEKRNAFNLIFIRCFNLYIRFIRNTVANSPCFVWVWQT